MAYTQMYNGRWYWITRKGSSTCCDCGAVHDEEYRIEVTPSGRKRILYRPVHNRRKTIAARRRMGIAIVPAPKRRKR